MCSSDLEGKQIHFAGASEDYSSNESPVVPFSATAVPDSNGKFSVDVRIPPVLFPIGDYYITSNYGGLTNTVDFSIISENSSKSGNVTDESNLNTSIPGKQSVHEKLDAGGYVVASVKTIIEKTNRISDNLISIETKDKTIDSQSVQPRVLSGSMITPSKADVSNVNIQIGRAHV